MAITTAGTYLMYKVENAYIKLCDITNYPDLGGTPSKIDTTDLSKTKFKTAVLGLQESPDLSFEANYEKEMFKTISGLTEKYDFAIYFGNETGIDGKYGWNGSVMAYINGGGVDEVRKMTIVCSAETEITEII